MLRSLPGRPACPAAGGIGHGAPRTVCRTHHLPETAVFPEPPIRPQCKQDTESDSGRKPGDPGAARAVSEAIVVLFELFD